MMTMRSAAFVSCFCIVATAVAAPPPVEAPAPWPEELPLRVVDEAGEPVEGAKIGIRVVDVIDGSAAEGGTALPTVRPLASTRQGNGWQPVAAPPTDGVGNTLLPTRLLLGKAAETLVGIDPTGRRIGALRLVRDHAGAPDRLSMTLRSAPLVRGSIGIKALARFGEPDRADTLGFDGVDLAFSRDDGLQVMAFVAPGRFAVPLPPGRYAWGSWHPHAMRERGELLVPEDAPDVEFPRIDLEPLRFLLLAGEPAPELRGLYGWANTEPLTLADLRGKVVLLDFWGVWCGPCLAAMPELVSLHERYKDRGLVVLGVHCADGEDPVTSAEELTRRLDLPCRRKLIGDRVPPFPIALTRLPPENEEAGHGLPAQDYGISAYPTALLIGRDGRLIGKIDPSEGTAAVQVEAALRPPVVAPKPVAAR